MRSFKELREDPYRPSSANPKDYVFVGAADMHPKRSWIEMRHDVLARHGVETGNVNRHSVEGVPFYDTDNGRWLARCNHCGSTREGGLSSNIYYFCFFLHKDSGVVITLGRDCAEKQNFGTKAERDFQTRRDEYFRQAENTEVYDFLRRWATWRARGGKYFSFLDSLWNQLQEKGYLNDKQIVAVRESWMNKPQPWMEEGWRSSQPQQQMQMDADRHKTEVTHTEEPPTDAQIAYIKTLCEQIDQPFVDPEDIATRQDASELINRLKAAKQHSEPYEPATERQTNYINSLMDERTIPVEKRREARQWLDNGITRKQASVAIEKLLTYPKVEETP